MRPRVFPAEDIFLLRHNPCQIIASMRPRVFPAEDGASVVERPLLLAASMRPRVFPAEDVVSAESSLRTLICFNEAAGIPRGRRRSLPPPAPRSPRFNEAAGIPRGRLQNHDRKGVENPSFNEAAGIPRGRPGFSLGCAGLGAVASMRPRVFPAEDLARRECSAVLATSFNEAAGIPRGRRCDGRFQRARGYWVASMRPRVFPAEDPGMEVGKMTKVNGLQ